MIPETLECAEILLQRGSERTRDCAALLVNNLAGMGGDESIVVISKRPSLISELMHMIAIGNVSVCMCVLMGSYESIVGIRKRPLLVSELMHMIVIGNVSVCMCVLTGSYESIVGIRKRPLLISELMHMIAVSNGIDLYIYVCVYVCVYVYMYYI